MGEETRGGEDRRLPSTRWSPSVSVEGEAYKEGYSLITCPALYDFVVDFCLRKGRRFGLEGEQA